MAEGIYKITEAFEEALAAYTGAPYAVALDNGSNALFLALMRVGIQGQEITIPARTYPSVPCAIIQAGGRVRFEHRKYKAFEMELSLCGAYQLKPTPVWDSALRFTADMYVPGTFMCCSFTGPHKRLKLGKAGAILTDDPVAYQWFKRARYSGRRECSYHEDDLDMLGWNYYLLPEIAAQGLRLMAQIYGPRGLKLWFPDITLPYPDLSKFEVYR